MIYNFHYIRVNHGKVSEGNLSLFSEYSKHGILLRTSQGIDLGLSGRILYHSDFDA